MGNTNCIYNLFLKRDLFFTLFILFISMLALVSIIRLRLREVNQKTYRSSNRQYYAPQYSFNYSIGFCSL